MDEYQLSNPSSMNTDTFISNRSNRSKSNRPQGISMSRDKTITLDNIY